MKYYDEFEEQFSKASFARKSMEAFEQAYNIDVDAIVDPEPLKTYYEYLFKNGYKAQTIDLYYRMMRYYIQMVDKKEGRVSFDSEGLVNVRSLIYKDEISYLFFGDIIDDLDSAINDYIESISDIQGDKYLLEDYFIPYKAVLALCWNGFYHTSIPSIREEDVDLKNHTVCGKKIHKGWKYIRELYGQKSIHVKLFGKVVETPYINNGYLFKHRKKPTTAIAVPVAAKAIVNIQQKAVLALGMPSITLNEVLTWGILSRFIQTPEGLSSTALNRDPLYEFTMKDMYKIDNSPAFQKRYLYDRYDLYKRDLLKYFMERNLIILHCIAVCFRIFIINSVNKCCF